MMIYKYILRTKGGYFSILLLVCLFSMPIDGFSARNKDKNIGWPGYTLSGEKCRGNAQGFGPFDYSDKKYTVAGKYTEHGSSSESPLKFVEKAHFDYNTEQLIMGKTGVLPTDIDYTLRAFPNHYRALWSMIKFQLKFARKKGVSEKIIIPRPYNSNVPPPECYLNRAIKFSQYDITVYMLYGLYLHKRGALKKALDYYKTAEKAESNNSELFYNMGLLYIDLKDIEKAKIYAKKAYSLNYPLPGLKNKLRRIKK